MLSILRSLFANIIVDIGVKSFNKLLDMMLDKKRDHYDKKRE
jgi:hypothetical protein